MAERRMFSKAIISSARFLRMPPSSRLLYYDLGMCADDEGVVEAFTVMRQTNATEDDLRVLVAKGFVTILNDDLVSLIMDWKENNYIRADRLRPSLYRELLINVSDTCQSNVSQLSDTCQSNVSIGEDRIGEDRVGKGSKEKRSRFIPPSVEEVREYCTERGNSIDPEAFVDYYKQQGWKLSNGNMMKDWKASVRTWEKRDNESHSRNNQDIKSGTGTDEIDYGAGWGKLD